MESIAQILQSNGTSESSTTSPSSPEPQTYTCDHCGNTVEPFEHTLFGKTRHVIRRWCDCDGAQADRQAEQQADRDYQARQLIINAGLQQGKLSRFTFDAWDTRRNQPHTHKALEQIKAYVESVNRFGQNWLYISGAYGLGKTHLAVAALRTISFERMWKPHYVLWPAHCAKVQESWAGATAGPTEGQLWARMRQADILLIDDVDKRDATAWAMGKLYEVVDARYLAEKPTMFTANSNIKKLEGRWKKKSNEQVRDLGEATLSRIMEQLCGAIEFRGEDQRWARMG